ncbi:MAG: DUF1559 domain-containing protein [Thermoguttaceae bacterium]|jgi:hypothetical protein|nr:DUF1559 domain-containing protein [Thermoguttaceae bacterium]
MEKDARRGGEPEHSSDERRVPVGRQVDAGLPPEPRAEPPVGAASSHAWVAWIVVLAMLGVPLVLLSPAVLSQREAARRARCISNLKQIGLASYYYYDRFQEFPASRWDRTNGFGWSWLVDLLPYTGEEELFDCLNVRNYPPTGDAAMVARPTPYVCPSYTGPAFVDDGRGGIANYKAMGATTRASLAFYDATARGKAPYATAAQHPDGASFPGRPLRMADFGDGLAHTFIATETIEEKSAVWQDGSTATLVGFPDAVNRHIVGPMNPRKVGWLSRYAFVHFANFDLDTWRDEAENQVAPSVRTYLIWDYAGADGPYEGVNYVHGASSNHPDVVNHLLGDASVQSVSTAVDPSGYWFTTTRSGGDPTTSPPCAYY